MTANGIHTNRNCKPILCISTGEVYTSLTDAANMNHVGIGTLSHAISKGKTCRGKKYCMVADITKHFDEVAEAIRTKHEKAKLYEEIIAEREARKIASENLAYHQSKCEELKQKLEKELKLLTAAELEMSKWRN